MITKFYFCYHFFTYLIDKKKISIIKFININYILFGFILIKEISQILFKKLIKILLLDIIYCITINLQLHIYLQL